MEVRPVRCDEAPHVDEPALPYARRIAEAKLRAALVEFEGRRVLAADTVVWREDDAAPLGKPVDARACAAMLEHIGGPNGHQVTTAWALGSCEGDVEVHAETTRVWFRALARSELDAYLHTEAWRDKAGGYGIQAEASSWVRRIEGSYTNVVGLPVAQVVARLQELAR